VVVIRKGQIMANDSVERLRDLMNLPSLVDIFAELTEERDLKAAAHDIAGAI
jgi:hypothetical protein